MATIRVKTQTANHWRDWFIGSVAIAVIVLVSVSIFRGESDAPPPTDPIQKQVLLALAYHASGTHDRAREELVRVAEAHHSDAETLAIVANALKAIGDLHLALGYAERALHLDNAMTTEMGSAFCNIAQGYYELGEFEEARRILDSEVLPNWPNNAKAHYWLAMLRQPTGTQTFVGGFINHPVNCSVPRGALPCESL